MVVVGRFPWLEVERRRKGEGRGQAWYRETKRVVMASGPREHGLEGCLIGLRTAKMEHNN